MELQQLRYFLTVAEEGNIGRAAARLHMTQPPLSRQIHLLERQEGVHLFVRTPRGVELTAAGEALKSEAPEVLRSAERASLRLRQAGEGRTGHLDVGIFSAGELAALLSILRSFRKHRPDVEVNLHDLSKGDQLTALHEGRIHIGFSRIIPHQPGFVIEDVRKEPLLAAIPAGHPLALKETVSLEDLEDEPMILYPRAELYGLAQEVTAAFTSAGLRLNVARQADDIVTCLTLVSCGYGLSITTESARYFNLPNVTYRPLRCEGLLASTLSCAYREDDHSPTLGAFLDDVRSIASDSDHAVT